MGLKKRSKVTAEFSMASLTDIIFLLLIFFMLTSTLVSQNALNLKLPSSGSKTVAPQSIAVSIEQGGKYYLNGTRISLSKLQGQVSRLVRNEDNRKNATVSIFADKDVALKHVAPILDIANNLKINAILATDPN